MKLRIGTRGSALALWQARWVAARLTEITGKELELVIVKTTGDKDHESELASFGGAGAFTREIDTAQRRGDFEVSVHSLKDLPTQGREGLPLIAVPERAPVEDCLVSRDDMKLDELPQGARVGTGSPRRAAQLKRLRPDVEVVPIRGNVPTRIEKVRKGDVDATFLAHAGLKRLELEHEIAEVLAVHRMVPAAGQGALGIVVREEAADAIESALPLNHVTTRLAVEVERSVIATLGAGCHAPLGVHAVCDASGCEVVARLVGVDGSPVVERGTNTHWVGVELA
jgi:hydroxymethylbilane synthase